MLNICISTSLTDKRNILSSVAEHVSRAWPAKMPLPAQTYFL